jgi:glycerophosphoryl diester phosphodiesterase
MNRAGTMAALGVACLLAVASCRVPADGPLPATGESGSRAVYVIGHRGAAGLAPENTLASFARACDVGVDAFELDVLVSADDKVVVYHDFRLKPAITRSPDGQWLNSASPPRIKDLRLTELKTYDVGRLKPGTRYSRRYPDQKPVDGERIPTLREAVGLLKQQCAPATQLWVEIKTSPEAPDLTPPPEIVSEMVIKILREEKISKRTRILSFDWRNLAHVQKIAPEIPTVYVSREGVRLNNIKPGRPGASPWMAGLDIDEFSGSIPHAIQAAGGRCWAPYYKELTASSLRTAHELGIEVFVWTPDSQADIKRLIEMGVDGIITNRPDRANR